MANDSPASVLVDENGNLIGVELDGAVYRLQTRTKLATGHGLATESKLEAVRALVASIDAKDFATETTQATLATESKLEAVRVILASIDAKDFATETTSTAIQAILAAIRDTAGVKKITDALPPGTNLIGRVRLRNPGDSVDIGDAANPVRTDPTGTTTQPVSAASLPLPAGAATETTLATRATETTLAAAKAVLDTIDAVLDSIKDADGIKKITDQLPAGTNEIGKVGQGTAAALANGWPVIIIDENGNAYDSQLDAGVRRLEISGKVSVIGSVPPPSTNAAVINADTPLTVGTHDTEFIIPDTETYHLQEVVLGNEDPTKGAKVEVLYFDGTVEHLVARVYTAGFTTFIGYNDVIIARDGTPMTGDGSTKKIIVRRSKYSGSDIAIDAVVRAYTV